jgi:hypothetical protein
LNESHSILQLLITAGPVVKVVIAILLLASLASWTIIFRKKRLLSLAESEANRFEGTFWSGGDLGQLYRAIGKRSKPAVGMESIFEAGFGSSRACAGSPCRPASSRGRAPRHAGHQLREIDRLEASLATLATVGSTSPYVRLFGTVWESWRLPGPRRRTAGDARDGGTGHCGGADRNRCRSLCGHPRRRATTATPTRWAGSSCVDAFMDEFSTLLQRHAASRA